MSGRGFAGRLKRPNENSAAVSKPRRDPPEITWKHSWSLDETKTALTLSDFRTLPTEVLLHIFKFLNVHDLGNVSSVCRSFKMIADQDEIWKLKSNSSVKLHSKSFKEIYMDWMYEKYLRNLELEKVEEEYLERSSRVACGMRCGPPQYPMRPEGKHQFASVGGFTQHPNESQEMTINLSVDVDKTAIELISLLEKASIYQDEWRHSAVIKQMILRYYRFMQLKASSPNNLLLVPTLDIEIIWQTHLLRPEMYRQDCMRLFHRIIDHSLIINNDIEQFLKEQAFIDTCKLYKERFGEEYCPLPEKEEAPPPKYSHPVFGSLKCLIPIYSYWDQSYYPFSSTSTTSNNDENPFSFTEADIILDANWLELCKKFMKTMVLELAVPGYYQYDDHIDLSSSALKRLKKSYERFLYMATKYPPSNGYQFVHPTYAIDIIWHSHMQEPIKYASDCLRLAGYIIDHAPWPSVDQSEMKSSCNNTIKSWEKEFQSDMSKDHLYNTKEHGYDDWDD